MSMKRLNLALAVAVLLLQWPAASQNPNFLTQTAQTKPREEKETLPKDESPPEYYQWNGKKTEFQDGYIVLRSGKRLEGAISVKRDKSEITLKDATGKKITFDSPATSLLAFGLIIPQIAVSETPMELYNWRSLKEVDGVAIVRSRHIFTTA